MKSNNLKSAPPKICFGDNCFEIEIAKTLLQKMKGLMFRKHLSPNSGMLFIFNSEGRRIFWMKFVKIPLDLIFLNSNKEIVYIEKNALPCRGAWCKPIRPRVKAQYVLEINGNLSEKLGLKIGGRAEINI